MGGDKDPRYADGKSPFERPFWPGQRGYSHKLGPYRKLPGPARQSLSRVEEPFTIFMPDDFNRAPFAKLSPDDVKKVGSCTIDGSSMSAPAKGIPEYKSPKVGIRMEKEKGQKRPPTDGEAYKSYVSKRCTLVAMAQQAAAASMRKDFVVDRSVLSVLLDFLNHSLTEKLIFQGQRNNPVDLVKVSKKAGKGLVLERLFEKKNLWAQRRGYRGAWKRSEASENGTYSPAWMRVATGDTSKKCLMITGLQQVAGTRAGLVPSHYEFSEYELGGMTFLSRAMTNAVTGDGKVVELKHKNWYYRQELTMLDAYFAMLLGNIDLLVIGLQRSGKLIRVVELTLEGLVEKQPGLVEAAERRLGRLASLLARVKKALQKTKGKGEGPWVLQWQNRKLVLGPYKEQEVPEEEEAEEEMPEEFQLEA